MFRCTNCKESTENYNIIDCVNEKQMTLCDDCYEEINKTLYRSYYIEADSDNIIITMIKFHKKPIEKEYLNLYNNKVRGIVRESTYQRYWLSNNPYRKLIKHAKDNSVLVDRRN